MAIPLHRQSVSIADLCPTPLWSIARCRLASTLNLRRTHTVIGVSVGGRFDVIVFRLGYMSVVAICTGWQGSRPF
eukprot:scaffold23069_cov36-Tisochrysis_lutea.AAC.3